MSDDQWISGLVIRAQTGIFTVETGEHGLITAQARGRLLQERLNTDPVAIGDRVKLSLQSDGSGTIEQVLERERAFTRQMPSPGGRTANEVIDREQVIIANPDQVVFVFACEEPAPRFKMLDRLLVIAEKSNIPPLICANKIDLVKPRQAKLMFDLYDALGYPVIYTSALTGKGTNRLHKALTGKISALTGPSGAGKSSLLNAIQPGLGLTVKSISEATTKGRHTTVVRELFPLEGGGYVADTPGIRAIGLYNVEPSEIDGYFRDISPYIGRCRFSDCRHEEEPGCAVRAAVKKGDIWWERYESYLRLRAEMEEIYYRC